MVAGIAGVGLAVAVIFLCRRRRRYNARRVVSPLTNMNEVERGSDPGASSHALLYSTARPAGSVLAQQVQFLREQVQRLAAERATPLPANPSATDLMSTTKRGRARAVQSNRDPGADALVHTRNSLHFTPGTPDGELPPAYDSH